MQAKQTLVAALETVDEGGTIILSAGTYDNKSGLTLDKAVTIRGADGVSRDDIIIAGYVYNSSTALTEATRNFCISNKDAMITGVTITGGATTNKTDVGGGSIYIASGTVSNCVERGGNSCWSGAVGHCVYLGGADALLADSLISDGLSHAIYGTGGGTVANSAIVNNSSSTPKTGYDHFYWCYNNDKGKKYGTLLYSADDYSDEDSSNWTGENNISGALEDFDFVDPENGNWRPGKNSILFDKGSLEWNRVSGDLDGNTRVIHKNRIDFGCYEHQYISPATIMMLK